MFRTRVAFRLAFVTLCVAIALGGALSTAIGEGVGHVDTEDVFVVTGDDAAVVLHGAGYTDCAGQATSAFLLTPAEVPSTTPGSQNRFRYEPIDSAERWSVTATQVSRTGSFIVSLPTRRVAGGGWTGFAALTGDCVSDGSPIILARIRLGAKISDGTLKDLQTGLALDDIPPTGSIIVIPSVGIDRTPILGDQEGLTPEQALDHVTVYANGEKCSTLDLKEPTSRDQAGDGLVVLGRAGQPSACGEDGAALTFTDGPADYLLSTTAVVRVGVMQPVQLIPGPLNNTGADRALDADSLTPVAPVDGTGVASTAPARWPMVAGVILFAIAIAAFGAIWNGRTR